jgi:hypothetical protein
MAKKKREIKHDEALPESNSTVARGYIAEKLNTPAGEVAHWSALRFNLASRRLAESEDAKNAYIEGKRNAPKDDLKGLS